MNCRIVIFGLLLAILIPSPLVRADDAGRETPFSMGAGAEAIGMGGGQVAMATNSSAVFYNPGGLANLNYQEVSFAHSVLFEGTVYDFASWVHPITKDHGVGGGYMRIGTGDIIRRENFADRGLFDYAYSQMLLAYGRNLGESMSAGVTLKIVNQSLAGASDFGIGLDVGFTASPWRNFSIGLTGRDLLQPELKLVAVTEKTPTSVVGGLALTDLRLTRFLTAAAALDLEKYEDRDLKVLGGVELRLYDALALRGGYHRDNAALGVGFKQGRLAIDYAYQMVSYVEDIHHVSVSFLIGKSVAEQIRLRELALLPPEPTEEEKHFQRIMDAANGFFHKFQLDSAAICFRAALDLKPTDKDIIGTLAAIAEARREQRQQEVALQAARQERDRNLASFMAQADLLYAGKSYAAALDLLEIIFDGDPDNLAGLELKQRIENTRASEIRQSLIRADQAATAERFVEALENYNRIIAIDPANTVAHRSRQQVLERMDLPQGIRLGIEMFEEGNLVEARRRFEAVLDINPNESLAHEYIRRISEAEERASTLEDIRKDPLYWNSYLEGLRQMRNKEYQQAIDSWEKVLLAYPNNVETIDNLEQARLRLDAQSSGD